VPRPDVADDLIDPAGNALHLRLVHAARGDRGRTDAHAAGEGPSGIVWNGVGIGLVPLGRAPVRPVPCHAFVSHINENEMIISATADQGKAMASMASTSALALSQSVVHKL
jgi:hypothetical protein